MTCSGENCVIYVMLSLLASSLSNLFEESDRANRDSSHLGPAEMIITAAGDGRSLFIESEDSASIRNDDYLRLRKIPFFALTPNVITSETVVTFDLSLVKRDLPLP